MTFADSIEEKTGRLFSDLWHRYDDVAFKDSVDLWRKRWIANGEPPDYFQGKRCLDAGCGGGRYSIALSLMGAAEVVGVDVGVEGLTDARRRAASIGLSNVTFSENSVLDLRFPNESFDFACCSGVLHHTPGVELGLKELFRVLKPNGALYLLLYGAGGLYWPLNMVMRNFASVLGRAEIERCAKAAGFAPNKQRTVLDDFFVPILETYTVERVDSLLRVVGFSRWRRWKSGNLDHESSPEAIIQELEQREHLWQSGADTSTDSSVAGVELHLAHICREVVESAKELYAQFKAGLIAEPTLRGALIGSGHHRILAQK